jgi:hypothetical protein
VKDRDEKGYFQPGHSVGEGTRYAEGNQARTVHGGEGAIKRISEGKRFIAGSPASSAELRVYEQIEQVGLCSYLESRAVQVEAVADLFFSEIAKAARAHDAEVLDKRVKRWGWLRGVADRTWRQVREMQKEGPAALNYDQLIEELRQNEQKN